MGWFRADFAGQTGHSEQQVSQLPAKSPGRNFFPPMLRISLILGICVHLLGFLFFRVISEPLPERPDGAAYVQLVAPAGPGSGEVLEERAELMDTAPLFLPRRWNAANNLPAPADDLTLQRFPLYQPEIDVLAQLQPERTPIGEQFDVNGPADLLALRYRDLFQGFGERALPRPKLEPLGSFAEVSSLEGRSIRTIPVTFEWRSANQPNPATFTLRKEAGGRAIGPPVLDSSSGNADFDAAALGWLNDSGNTAHLQAGLYRIRIYPGFYGE